jgi:hypothetical protein
MIRSFLTISALCLSLVSLNAATITYTTPSGSTDNSGDAVNASAVFTTSNGVLQITLNDLQPNIKDAGQLLTDLEFTLSVGGTNTLVSSSGKTITVNAGGPTTAGSTGPTGWGFGIHGSDLILCSICGNSTLSTPESDPRSSGGLIGPGPYTSANPSIAGNGPHNPFIDETATFTIDNALINSDTRVTSATFSFGTTFGDDVAGRTGSAPEPLTCALTGAGFVGLFFARRFRRMAK